MNNDYLKGLVFPLAILGAWSLLSSLGMISSTLIPSPQEVGSSFLYLLQTGEFGSHLAISLRRICIGFAWSAIIGIPLGVLIGLSKIMRELLNPLLQFMRQIPPIAWIPIFVLWLGIGEASKNVVIVYAAVFPIFLNTVLGVSSIEKKYFEVASMLELKGYSLLREVIIPAFLPGMLTGLRLGLGNSWRALVAAEMVAAANGLGYMIMAARSMVRVDEMFVGILSIGILGYGMDQIFLKVVERKGWRAE